MGGIPTNYEESTRWLEAYQAEGDLESRGGTIRAFAPCALTYVRQVKDKSFSVAAFGGVEYDRTRLQFAAANDPQRADRTFSDRMSLVCINGPSDIERGGYGKVTRDWPAIARVGDSDYTLREMATRGFTLIPDISSSGIVDRLGRAVVVPQEAVGGVLSYYANSAGLYRKVDAASGFIIVKLVDDADGDKKEGLCWVSPSAPQERGFETPFTIASEGDFVSGVSGQQPLTGDAGAFAIYLTTYNSSLPSGDEFESDFFQVPAASTGIGNELWFKREGVYDLRAWFRFTVGDTLSPSDTIDIANLSISVADVSEDGYGRVSIDGYNPPIVETLSPAITGITGGYADPQFTLDPCYRTLHLNTRLNVRRSEVSKGMLAKMRLEWSRDNSDLSLKVLGGGLLRLVINRSTVFNQDESSGT